MTQKEHCSLEQEHIEIKEELNFNTISPSRLKQNKLVFQKYTQYFDTVSEMLWYYKHPETRYCPVCGKKNKFNTDGGKYYLHCSLECKYKDESRMLKAKETKLKRYGDPNYQNIEKIVETRKKDIDKNGLNSYQRGGLKAKQTCLNKIDSNGLNEYDRASKKAVNTLRNKINKDGLNGIQLRTKKARETALHNVDSNGLNSYQRGSLKGKQNALNNIDDKGLNSYQRGAIKCTQAKLANIDENGMNSIERGYYKKLLDIDKNGLNGIQRANLKAIETKRINHTFNSSSAEKKVFELLQEKFNEVKRNYRSKEYPFCCDFYVKDIDTYIECNFHWTHGHYNQNILGTFDKNNPIHLKVLSIWKNKKDKYYDNAIQTWTVRDVNKIISLQKNNLKYKIFWNNNLTDFYNWYNNI